MKRYLCFMLAAVMLLTLAACGAPAAPVIETAPPAAADAAPDESGDAGEFTPNISCANTVEVSTVDEFLAAIASDTMIVLAAGIMTFPRPLTTAARARRRAVYLDGRLRQRDREP